MISTNDNPTAELTTMGRTVVIGPPDENNAGYSGLQLGHGEPHVVRTDITRALAPVSFALTSFAQMTDLHITDDQSPLRVEWLDRYANLGPPHNKSYPFAAAYRTNECLSAYVLDAMCRALNSIGRGPRTGLPLAFTIVSGDAIDNAQFNEVRWYIDVLDGQGVTPDSGGTFDHSVTGDSLGLDINYWHPSNRDFELSNQRGPGLDLNFQAGFPEVKQLPGAARRQFSPQGLRMPWFAAYGNHDLLVQGNAPIDGMFKGVDIKGLTGLDLKAIALGTFKRMDIAEPLPAAYTGDLFDYPTYAKLVIFQDFAGLEVPADPRRRLIDTREFMTEHFDTHGAPTGHGFELNSGVAYYVMPDMQTNLIRHIVLDTTDPDGGARGWLGPVEAEWLEQQLTANSSRYFTNDAVPLLVEQTAIEDRLFVIHSHHAINAMDSSSGAVLERILLRFPNVILQVNGHNHRNLVTPHERPWVGSIAGGFWEVSTASQIDWPIQSRLFEITLGRGVVSIFTTMVDIDAPLDFRQGDIHDPTTLAALSRELAANDLQQRGDDGGISRRPGAPSDRNTQLLVPTPFPLPNPMVFGSPIAASRDSSPVRLVGTDAQDGIWCGALDSSEISWSQIDGALRCVCLETDTDGRLELFGLNRDGVPFLRSETATGSNTWTPWVLLPGQFTSIAAARNADGRVELFATDMFDSALPDGPTGLLRHSTQVTPAMTDWSSLDDQGDIGLVQVAAVATIDGRVALFGVTSGSMAVVQRVQTSPGEWAGSTWQLLGAVATSIAVARSADGAIDVFISDEDGRVLQTRVPAPGQSAWAGWSPLDVDWASLAIRQLAVGSDGATLTLIGLDTNGQAYARTHTAEDPSIWRPWTALPAVLRPTRLPTTAPHVSPVADQSTFLGAPVDLRLTSVGGIGTITWTYAGLPPGLVGDSEGTISGAPVASGTATHPVTATATDANYTADSVSFTWTTLVHVPNVMSWPRADAVAELVQADLTIGPDSVDNHCIDIAGTVLAQSRSPGGVALEGAAVTLTISSGMDKHGHKCPENK